MTSAELLPALSVADDTFCLAVLEYGGNLGAAFRAAYGPDVPLPVARARELITRPEIAKRIFELTEATQEHALISLGSHLVKLAEIRDLATDSKQLKVALDAEKQRGIAVGFYENKQQKPGESPGGTMIQINIGSSPANVDEWSAKHGKKPLVVDV